jgi:predicted metal-binding membrane protein
MRAIGYFNTDRRQLYLAAVSLVFTAWLVLAVWSLSPYAAWLDHASIENTADSPTVRLAVFTLGWMLMIVAMMLPSTLLLLDRCSRGQPLSVQRITPVILAYLAVWTVFGCISYLSDMLLHEFVEQTPSLAGVIAPVILLLAGVYQLTPMKRVCLSRCRSGTSAFMTLEHPNLWNVGLRHGLFCLGSCWALMLLMFAIGGVNLLWMPVLGAIMTAERLSLQGEGVAQLLGVILIIASVLLVIR